MIVTSAKERSIFLETLHSIQPIKLFNKENQRQGLWQTKLANAYNVGIKTEQFSTAYSVLNKMIFSLENILILYFCTQMIINPQLTFSLGMMYAFLQYKGQFIGAVSSLVDNFFQLKFCLLSKKNNLFISYMY
jgi:ATP-binding cassette subfamily B protein RaxB